MRPAALLLVLGWVTMKRGAMYAAPYGEAGQIAALAIAAILWAGGFYVITRAKRLHPAWTLLCVLDFAVFQLVGLLALFAVARVKGQPADKSSR